MLPCYVFDKQGKIHITIEDRCKIKVWWEAMITLERGIGITGYGWTGNGQYWNWKIQHGVGGMTG